MNNTLHIQPKCTLLTKVNGGGVNASYSLVNRDIDLLIYYGITI